MKQMNHIEVFRDTSARLRRNVFLALRTKRAVNQTRIYEADFRSSREIPAAAGRVTFQENTTLLAAGAYKDSGKRVAVLNFANPVEPGGGVLRGASAQEEYLCRASNLYPCLTSDAAADWYRRHRAMWGQTEQFMASDRVIYTPSVTIIREDKGYAPGTTHPFRQEYTRKWQNVDVITAAAPYFSSVQHAQQEPALRDVLRRRIRNILETAIDHGAEILILGAFGCGAFHNPPDIVAEAFRDLLTGRDEERYRSAFEEICFAVMRDRPYSRNIEEFKRHFG